jgi:iron complex outermembrane receptor protein
MLDIEVGSGLGTRRFSASLNLYAMEYWNMLLETGRLSSSGYAIKENIPRAWRRGVELCAGWEPLDWLRLDGNATLSLNQIADYTSYVPYEDYSATHPVHYGKTTMLMSPSLIGMLRLSLKPWKGGQFTVDGKYVGRQFIDNSMRDEMVIPAYWLANLSLGHVFPIGRRTLAVTAYVNNFLNRLYYASGWRWESYDAESGQIYTGIGVYPQPPCNFMVKLSLSF